MNTIKSENNQDTKLLYKKQKRSVIIAISLAALFYAIMSITSEAKNILSTFKSFYWIYIIPIAILSLGNYVIRFIRWHFYLYLINISVPIKKSFYIFWSGLSMSITPGKAGELLKSWLLKDSCNIPISISSPVIFAERLTDLFALLFLASVGIWAYYPNLKYNFLIFSTILAIFIVLMNNQTIFSKTLHLMKNIPYISTKIPIIENMYRSSMQIFQYKAFLAGMILAIFAWLCECIGYYLVFVGYQITNSSIPTSIFIYSFSTVAGVLSPGGLGFTDAALKELSCLLIPNLPLEIAICSAFIIRLMTLWFAVLAGSVGMLKLKD